MCGTRPLRGALGYTKDRPSRATGRANLLHGSSRRLGTVYGRRFVVFPVKRLHELLYTRVCSKLAYTSCRSAHTPCAPASCFVNPENEGPRRVLQKVKRVNSYTSLLRDYPARPYVCEDILQAPNVQRLRVAGADDSEEDQQPVRLGSQR